MVFLPLHLQGEWVKWPSFVGRADEEIHAWQGGVLRLKMVGFIVLEYGLYLKFVCLKNIFHIFLFL